MCVPVIANVCSRITGKMKCVFDTFSVYNTVYNIHLINNITYILYSIYIDRTYTKSVLQTVCVRPL